MLLLLILVYISILLEASLPTPILNSKPEPVDLSYTCTTIIEANQQDFKHDDVPVILLHGIGGSKETWHGIFELIALDTKKKVCVADLRNHGDSPWNDEEYDVISMTEDIRHLMDEINAHKAIVVGHSLGGRTAVHLALNYPERVEKIIVEDMRANGVLPEALAEVQVTARLLKELDKIIPQGVSEKEAKEKVFQMLKAGYVKLNVTSESSLPIKCCNGKCRLSLNPVLLDAVLRNVTELLNESSGRFDGPALFIFGAESPFKVGEDENNIKKIFPNTELVAVEGAGRMVHSSRKFVTEVIKFINSKR